MNKSKIKKTGERFIPTVTSFYEVLVNLERYLFAMRACKNYVVLDAGCGCGLGTYLLSLVAKKVIAVDYNLEALDYAKQFPYEKGKVQFIHTDLEEDTLPEHNVCVALEVIEHLENPDFFLSQLKCDELVFSVPLNSLKVSPGWHKQDFETLEDIKEILERYYKVPKYLIQDNKWIYGKAKKI